VVGEESGGRGDGVGIAEEVLEVVAEENPESNAKEGEERVAEGSSGEKKKKKRKKKNNRTERQKMKRRTCKICNVKGHTAATAKSNPGKGTGLYADFHELRKVCTHPNAFRVAEEIRLARYKNNSRDSEGASVSDDDGRPARSDDLTASMWVSKFFKDEDNMAKMEDM
jgi:hypothetical protein